MSFPHLYQGIIALNTVRTNCPLGVYILIHPWGWITDRRMAIHCLKGWMYWVVHPLQPQASGNLSHRGCITQCIAMASSSHTSCKA